MQNYVFVLNRDGKPLSPCHPAVARKLLKEDRAVVERVIPFTIRLVETKLDIVIQPTTIGIDDGAKIAGVAVVQHNQSGARVVFKTEVKLRGNVKKELSNRRMRRQARRSRLRHREPRWRRKDKTGWISPSIKVRKDNILRVVRDLTKLVLVARIVYEEGQFNTRALWDEKIEDYQQEPNSGFENRKKAVLWRDQYICQYCGVNCIEAGLVAEVDHILPRARGGTYAWRNLVCACQPCNRAKNKQTATEFGYPKIEGRAFTYPTWLQQGKTYLKTELDKIAPLEIAYGWQTSKRRKELGLQKSHINDAISLAISTFPFENKVGEHIIVARRRRRDMHNLRHKDGYAGFRHYDVVVWERRDGRKHLGTVRSFAPTRGMVNCRFDFSDDWGVSVGRLRLVQHSGPLVYLPQQRKESVPQPADSLI